MISREAVRRRRRKGLEMCFHYAYEPAWMTPRAIGKMGTTPKLCSCGLCGNPRRKRLRKNEQLTIQERRAFQAEGW